MFEKCDSILFTNYYIHTHARAHTYICVYVYIYIYEIKTQNSFLSTNAAL